MGPGQAQCQVRDPGVLRVQALPQGPGDLSLFLVLLPFPPRRRRCSTSPAPGRVSLSASPAPWPIIMEGVRRLDPAPPRLVLPCLLDPAQARPAAVPQWVHLPCRARRPAPCPMGGAQRDHPYLYLHPGPLRQAGLLDQVQAQVGQVLL